MQAWLESVAGPEYASALMWTVVALIALLVLLILIRIVRGLTFGTFVAGGRNRKARLAVMDATAVDSHRRLVLVRRDDVEHLILIGGPSDVVVEQNIRLLPPARRPVDEAAVAAPAAPPPVAQPKAPPAAERPAGSQPVPAAPPRQPAPPPAAAAAPVLRASPPPPAPSAPTPEPRFSSLSPSAPAPRPPVTPPPAAPPQTANVQTLRPVALPGPASDAAKPRGHDLDNALLEELEVTLEKDQQKQAASAPEVSLDEEMSKLLGDLSGKR